MPSVTATNTVDGAATSPVTLTLTWPAGVAPSSVDTQPARGVLAVSGSAVTFAPDGDFLDFPPSAVLRVTGTVLADDGKTYAVNVNVTGAVADVFFEAAPPDVASVNKVQLVNIRRLVVDVADGVLTVADTDPAGGVISAASIASNGWETVAHDTGWTVTSDGASAITVSLLGHYTVPDAHVREGTNLPATNHKWTTRRRWFLFTNRNMVRGETLTIHPTGRPELAMSLLYDHQTRSYAVNAPHHGFAPDSPDKRAIVGGWCGAAIPNLSTSTNWGLWDENAGAFVPGWGFNDTPPLVQERTASEATTAMGSSGGVDSNVTTGHDVFLADFSAFTTPGRYRVCVQNYGASYPFNIGDGVPVALFRHLARGIRYTGHGDEYRNDMADDAALRLPNPMLLNLPKRATARTVASLSPDGIGGGGKLWDNDGSQDTTYVYTATGNSRSVLREPDAVLNAIVPDDITEGYRDAADYDIRPQHLLPYSLTLMLAMASPAVRAVDCGFGEGRRPYSKTIMGGAITGTAPLADIDHLALHGIDGHTRMQVLASAGDWSAGAGKFPANLGNWSGSVRGMFELGGYVGNDINFASWQTTPFNNADEEFTLNFARPDPWSTYAGAAAFATAALRFRQLGDTRMETVYRVRAKAAWDWAAAHEGSQPAWLTPVATTSSTSKVNWDPAWRSNREFTRAKALAAVGLWALTPPGAERNSYHGAWRAMDETFGVGDSRSELVEAGALYLLTDAEPSIGVTGHDPAVVATLRTNAIAGLDALVALTASAGTVLYGVPLKGLGNFWFGNQVHTPGLLSGFLMPAFCIRNSLTATRQENLRKLAEVEIHFAAGRCPSGRTLITSFGHDFRRSVLHGDWRRGAAGFTTPGLVPFGLLGNVKATEADDATDSNTSNRGYSVGGATSAVAIPYAYREVVGNHADFTSGEWTLHNSLIPPLLAAGAALW